MKASEQSSLHRCKATKSLFFIILIIVLPHYAKARFAASRGGLAVDRKTPGKRRDPHDEAGVLFRLYGIGQFVVKGVVGLPVFANLRRLPPQDERQNLPRQLYHKNFCLVNTISGQDVVK